MNLSNSGRGRFQFRLSTLFALVLAVACFFAGRLSQQPALNELRSENQTLRKREEESSKLARDALDKFLARIAAESNSSPENK